MVDEQVAGGIGAAAVVEQVKQDCRSVGTSSKEVVDLVSAADSLMRQAQRRPSRAVSIPDSSEQRRSSAQGQTTCRGKES